jgi:hypothetical protein
MILGASGENGKVRHEKGWHRDIISDLGGLNKMYKREREEEEEIPTTQVEDTSTALFMVLALA